MKGFKDSSNKFHPITEYKGVRKSRNNELEQQIRFKRRKQTYGFRGVNRIYIAESTAGGWSHGGKPAPRKEIVETLKEMWNNDPTIKRMKKHIDYLTIQYSEHVKHVGIWDDDKKKLTIFDDGRMTPNDFKSLIVHEVIGHTFWHQSTKWRREELVEFNRLANEMPPVNNYVHDNEEKWRKWNDDDEDWKNYKKKYGEYNESDQATEAYQEMEEKLKENGHDTMTRYANEQHSAVAEIVYGYSYHKKLIDDLNLSKLVNAWEKLHY